MVNVHVQRKALGLGSLSPLICRRSFLSSFFVRPCFLLLTCEFTVSPRPTFAEKMSKSSAKSKTRGSSNKKGSRKGKGSLQNAIDKVTEKSGLGSITRKVARVVKNSDDEEEVKTPRRQDVAPRTEETPLIEEQKIPAKLEKSSLESAATAAKKARRVVVLGPLGDFLTADTTLIFVLAVLTSIYPTYVHWSEIVNDRIPFFPVTFCWLVVAHTGGWCVSVFVTARSKAKALQSHLPRSKILPEDTPLGRTVSPARARPQDKCMLPVDEQPLRGGRHRLLRGLFRGSRLRFESLEAPVSKVWKKRPAWSNLSRSVTVTDPTADLANGALMNRLLRTGNFRLVRKSKLAAKGLSTDETSKRLLRPSTSTPSTSSSSPRMGGISIVADADTLNDYVVDSLFKLRGMDVFLTDEVPEGRVGNHPWLIQQGLRDAPTFILNVLTQWGNLILYFEMPEWVEDWDGSPELVSDKEDVKAFKVSECIFGMCRVPSAANFLFVLSDFLLAMTSTAMSASS